MKRLLLVLTLGAALASPSFAQSNDAPPDGPPPGGGHHDHMGFLTDAQKAELKKDHDAVIANNPSLGTQEQDLMTQMKAAHEAGQPPSEDLKQKMHTLHDSIDQAMVSLDPAIAPVLAEIKAHHHGHGPGGPGGPPPSGTAPAGA